jgi:DNA polymerase-3 subunit epsilon
VNLLSLPKNLKIENKMNNTILVVDIETTGFLNKGGKIVEIGIVKLNLATGEITPAYNSLVREDGFGKHHTVGAFGWIFSNSDLTYEEVEAAPSLESQREVIQELFDEFYATAFNKAFDFDFLHDRAFTIKDLPCPMKVATPICKLPNQYGYNSFKWPTVEEAWQHFFGASTGYKEAHRGYDDAEHEAKIVYKLYELGHFELPFKVEKGDNVQLSMF